jgi:hypothetical protein
LALEYYENVLGLIGKTPLVKINKKDGEAHGGIDFESETTWGSSDDCCYSE